MAIGAVGSYASMTASAAYGVQTPYLYNTNRVSANSLNPVKPIGSDVVRAPKTDYSALAGLTGSGNENENPLKPFETSNFDEVLEQQFAISRQNAARIFG